MKKLFKILFLVIVLSIFFFSDNKTISATRNFCAVNGKATYDVVSQKIVKLFNNGSKKAVAYFEDNTKK